MKKYIFITTLLISISMSGQFSGTLEQGSEISFQVVQDGRLLLLGDDHGNDPLTSDLQFSFFMKGDEKKFGHYRAGCKYEYAELSFQDFKRWGAVAGFTFTNLPIPFCDQSKWMFTPMVGIGWMRRNDNPVLWSHEVSVEFSLPVFDWLNLIVLATETQRPDLKKYGDEWRFNLAAGIEIEFSSDHMKIKNGKTTRF